MWKTLPQSKMINFNPAICWRIHDRSTNTTVIHIYVRLFGHTHRFVILVALKITELFTTKQREEPKITVQLLLSLRVSEPKSCFGKHKGFNSHFSYM